MVPTDTERLDWLEHEAHTRDGIHLHNGYPDPFNNCRGIGLKLPHSPPRTLREAIDHCLERQSVKSEKP